MFHSLCSSFEENSSVYIDGCSFTSGIDDTRYKSWAFKVSGNKTVAAMPGKDNHSIFMDTMAAINSMELSSVIIYWTFPERYKLPSVSINPAGYWINKQEAPPMELHIPFWDHLKYQLTFMYIIQQECLKKKIKCFYLSVLPYDYYVKGDNGFLDKIDTSRFLNWPEYGNPLDAGNYVNCLTTKFGASNNCLGDDFKHLTLEGEQLFYDNIINPFLQDKPVNISWSYRSVIQWLRSNKDKKLPLRDTEITEYIYEN